MLLTYQVLAEYYSRINPRFSTKIISSNKPNKKNKKINHSSKCKPLQTSAQTNKPASYQPDMKKYNFSPLKYLLEVVVYPFIKTNYTSSLGAFYYTAMLKYTNWTLIYIALFVINKTSPNIKKIMLIYPMKTNISISLFSNLSSE